MLIDLYPTAVVSGQAFTVAQLANVLGNTADYAVHSGPLAVGAGLSGMFNFPMTSIPRGAVINSIVASVVARANGTSRRRFRSVTISNGAGTSTSVGTTTGLATTDATYSLTFTDTQLAANGWTTDALRDNGIYWNALFDSINATSTVTSWQMFRLAVDYIPPRRNRLFLMGDF